MALWPAAQFFPLLNGGIDLSIGSVTALSGSVMVLVAIASGYSTGGTILGIVLGLLAGTACGALNGLISYYFALPAFVVTLAMKNIILGVTQHITNRNTVICLYSDLMNWIGTGKILGVQFLIILFCDRVPDCVVRAQPLEIRPLYLCRRRQ